MYQHNSLIEKMVNYHIYLGMKPWIFFLQFFEDNTEPLLILKSTKIRNNTEIKKSKIMGYTP